tara:strand:- start:62 stop:616 length:555 start_codon:yes stop_codon:yes gene_type:complete
MGVPNTTTFSMQDVSSTVDPSKTQLTQLIEVANAQSPSLWDPAYSGSKNSLLNFRNYDAGVSNLLTVTATSSGFPPSGVILIQNNSVDSQAITYTWQYVSQTTTDFLATVQYGGTTRAVGYTTPTINDTLETNPTSNYSYQQPFSISGGNGATLTFKLVLLTAATDTVPSSPNNAASYSYCQNC